MTSFATAWLLAGLFSLPVNRLFGVKHQTHRLIAGRRPRIHRRVEFHESESELCDLSLPRVGLRPKYSTGGTCCRCKVDCIH